MTGGVHRLDYNARIKLNNLAIVYFPIAGIYTFLGSTDYRDARPLFGKHLVVAGVVMVFVGSKNSFWLSLYIVPQNKLHNHLEVAWINDEFEISLSLIQVLNRTVNDICKVVCQVRHWCYSQIANLINWRLIFQGPLHMGVNPVGSDLGKITVMHPSSYW